MLGRMNTNNELVAAIDSNRSNDNSVKTIRKQKYDPNNFYMSLSDGKQIGPVSVAGTVEDANRKFAEAQAYLASAKHNPAQARKAA